MKQLIIIFLILFPFTAYSICCGIPFGGHYYCKNGSETWGCCGVGPSDPWRFMNGCDMFCCDCAGGCKMPQNQDEWDRYCDGNEILCEEDCDGLEEEELCDEKCQDEQSNCYKNYPGNFNFKQE